MSETAADRPGSGGNSMYELFMGFMTITSLIVMALLLLVRVPEVQTILASTDTLFCLFFLADFGRSVVRAPDRRAYLVGDRPGRSLPTGIIDLLGSIPAIGEYLDAFLQNSSDLFNAAAIEVIFLAAVRKLTQ